jgi:hypothetical protein
MLVWLELVLIHGSADADVKPPRGLLSHCIGVLALSRDFFWYSERYSANVSASDPLSLLTLYSNQLLFLLIIIADNSLPVIKTVHVSVFLYSPLYWYIGHAQFLSLVDEHRPRLTAKECGQHRGTQVVVFRA